MITATTSGKGAICTRHDAVVVFNTRQPEIEGGYLMLHSIARWSQFVRALVATCIVSLIASAPMLAFAQSSDEAAIRAIADRFFVAYQSGNIKDVESLWDAKSPDFAGTHQQL